MTPQLDPIAMSLVRRITEAQDDVNAITGLPLDLRKGIAFTDGFARIGIRDQLVRDLADHLVIIPCEGVDTKDYQQADWRSRSVHAHKIASKVAEICKGEDNQ